MSHTDQFNKIMDYTNQAHKEKKEQRKITPVFIGGGESGNELQQSIAKCRIAANVVYLPPISEPLANYADVRKALLNAGGTYKNCSFIFPNDAQPYIDRLMGGKSVNIKKEFQFFATPAELADKLVKEADITQWEMILEPSAGQGAIMEAVLRECDYLNNPIDYCELMDVNRAVIEKKINSGLRGICVGHDFLLLKNSYQWDKIIANPPFNKNQDIDHIRKMYQVCKTGGRIATIASNSWRTGSQNKQVEFREWLEEINAVVEDIEAGAFKESGTNIATCMIIIDK